MAGPEYTPPEKHSLTLRGHRTSVSLEPEFWQVFRRIAARDGVTISALAVQIDTARPPEVGLASAIRVFVLRDLLQKGRAEGASSGGQIAPAPNH